MQWVLPPRLQRGDAASRDFGLFNDLEGGSAAMSTVTVDELATLFGIAPRTVRSLAERGIVVKAGRGSYDLVASVPRYCESLREAASGRGGEASVSALSSERARLAREQADAAALKNAASRRELVSATEVERVWSATLRQVQSRLLAVPNRVSQRTNINAHGIAVVEDEIKVALSDLASSS